MNPRDVKYGLRYLFRGREGVVEQISGHPRRGFEVKFRPSMQGAVEGGVFPTLCVPLGEFAAGATPADQGCVHDPEER